MGNERPAQRHHRRVSLRDPGTCRHTCRGLGIHL